MVKKRLTQFDMIGEMHKDIKEIKENLIPDIRSEINILKVKNSIWSSVTGLMGGMFAVLTIKLWR